MPGFSPPPAPRRLKRRADFLRAAAGKRFYAKAFTLQATAQANATEAGASEPEHPPRFGFTVTKKIGKAVVRNRIRRRLKEAVRTLDPIPARAGHDYVVIARAEALGLPFDMLQGELRRALDKIDGAKPAGERVSRKARRGERVAATQRS